uniref:Uncharacterized protein n=1 Tax=Arundo donax TaxID=35708 RepID=A0A0A9C538_ARUDO
MMYLLLLREFGSRR